MDNVSELLIYKIYAGGGEIMNRLAAYRKLIGLNQTQMAEELSMSLTSYSRKESELINFSETEMRKIVTIIREKVPEVTMDDIFFDRSVGKMLS
jgi:DNA-binding XRE family transcriptional regulator